LPPGFAEALELVGAKMAVNKEENLLSDFAVQDLKTEQSMKEKTKKAFQKAKVEIVEAFSKFDHKMNSGIKKFGVRLRVFATLFRKKLRISAR